MGHEVSLQELAHAQMAASKARKLDDKYQQVPEVERRVGSLDGFDVDSGFKQLRAQCEVFGKNSLLVYNKLSKAELLVTSLYCKFNDQQDHSSQNLELEKISMQQVGSLTEQVKVQATAAEDSLDKIQADMDRLQGMHRQELKESQKKLELALSDNVGLVEQLRAMDSFLAQKKAENQILEQKLQAVHAENESSRTALQARASEWWLRKAKTLVEKSKLEAEKVNKRESIVDERRESIATGLTKTKAQLSSAEHALQMKTVELEKSSFDLQLLQDSYATLEFAMCEMECGSITLKEKLAESEKLITILGQEKETAVHNMEKVAQELKVALELEQALDIHTGEVFGNENSDPQDTVSQ
ncbi:unnamed protein product [Sphagnum troendelagicum]|uniref:Myosin heavy chain n=1 Tax=Sphagnum troendelagicum TaxID=128251 RepID=A0ABP0TUS1_9BRYO